jgi:hypothetical protein
MDAVLADGEAIETTFTETQKGASASDVERKLAEKTEPPAGEQKSQPPAASAQPAAGSPPAQPASAAPAGAPAEGDQGKLEIF